MTKILIHEPEFGLAGKKIQPQTEVDPFVGSSDPVAQNRGSGVKLKRDDVGDEDPKVAEPWICRQRLARYTQFDFEADKRELGLEPEHCGVPQR